MDRRGKASFRETGTLQVALDVLKGHMMRTSNLKKRFAEEVMADVVRPIETSTKGVSSFFESSNRTSQNPRTSSSSCHRSDSGDKEQNNQLRKQCQQAEETGGQPFHTRTFIHYQSYRNAPAAQKSKSYQIWEI